MRNIATIVQYIFFFVKQRIIKMQRCKRSFRCIKQQTNENWQPKQIQLEKKCKSICGQMYEIESDPIERKELLKIINRAKIEVEQQIIMEEDDEDEDEEGEEIVVKTQKMTGEQFMKKVQELQKNKKNKEYGEKQIQEINKKFQQLKGVDKDQKDQGAKELDKIKKDYLFQQYKKVSKTINDPVLNYSNVPIPYNLTPLNPRHNCKHCNMKLQLEIQITQKILLFHKSLAILDWGSIFVFTCTGSCQQSQEECIVLQYELDAISEEEISKLKKTKTTRKKNKNKSLSKQKKRLQQKSKIQPELIKSSKEGFKQENDQKDDQGDWD